MSDLISRHEAIEICEFAISLWDGQLGSGALMAVKESIQSLPSVEPGRMWIPCSKRLPEESDYIGCSECIDGAVWYYTDKGAMGLGYYYESTKSWATTDDTAPYGNVVAWRKLPEPYAKRG